MKAQRPSASAWQGQARNPALADADARSQVSVVVLTVCRASWGIWEARREADPFGVQFRRSPGAVRCGRRRSPLPRRPGAASVRGATP